MANNKDKNSPPKKTTESEADLERLDKNERLAFEKIMGEIENTDKTVSAMDSSQEPHEDSKASSTTDSNTSEESLSEELDDEQQAALDKIMNEINGDASDDPPAADPEKADPEPAAGEALDDEQQAALDKIMNEINGDAPDDPPAADPEKADPEPAAGELDDEQQAALDKIMNEINGDDNEDDSGEETQIEEKTTLSIEEFNDELNSLLSEAATQKETFDTSASSKSASKTSTEVPDKSSAADVETPQETPTKAPDAPDVKESKTVSSSNVDNTEDYAILHEVTPSKTMQAKKANKRPTKKVRSKKGTSHKKVIQYTVAVLLLIGICGGVYWYYGLSNQNPVKTPLLSTDAPSELTPSSPDVSVKPADLQAQAPTSPPLSTIPQTVRTPVAQAAPSLNSLIDDLAATREHVLNKIAEIKELKTYYQNGVLDEYAKLKHAMTASKISSFKAALRDKPTELGLRAIQRRKVYITKLDIPIEKLTSASEELLFLERKTRIFETLNLGISDLAIPEFKKEVSAIISNHLKSSNELSIDHIKIKPPSLESIWNQFQSQTAKKSIKPRNPNSDLDKKINLEICSGNYGRKYLVTQLTPQSAKCIAQWSGKDLYLNGLSTLPPSVAKTIAQWPGEWLSLNGLKELSAESAKHLSQWKGKRLSLNGLTKLNLKATAYLSQWNGEQLEMVGLESIGRWENYGTRLYLSEHLRKKLQFQ